MAGAAETIKLFAISRRFEQDRSCIERNADRSSSLASRSFERASLFRTERFREDRLQSGGFVAPTSYRKGGAVSSLANLRFAQHRNVFGTSGSRRSLHDFRTTAKSG